ncbi:hypothetical protein JTE90_025307 [Oedothorax gibbosus]|uniref:Metalloendopeptidase n=1 Tax=Oedothorax gibbosus TaxID=931172 RepID=A0AAV6V8V9_9ARAC|nr:hypothetical protein JTE90_025307 [Oedothorax gibbosus]
MLIEIEKFNASDYSVNENNTYVDPIEASGQFEGDIVLSKIQQRNAIRNEDLKWPGGVVPYTMPLFFGVQGRIMVALAVSEFSRNTCVRFVTRTNQTDYLALFRGGGCYSMVGRMGGKQELSLATDCDQMGIVIHEFMHALGFWHEQSRIDRDQYVRIRWENISPGTENNFQKYSAYIQQTLDEEYDYSSVLHYSGRAFSKNGRATVEPKQFMGNFVIGQRLGFSRTDIKKINKLYNCTGYF